MIIETEDWDIIRHKIAHGQERKFDYLVYSFIIRNHMSFLQDEDVLMIYSNITHNRIFFDERFLTFGAGGGGIELAKFLKEPGVMNNIAVMGYDQEEFTKKYFILLL